MLETAVCRKPLLKVTSSLLCILSHFFHTFAKNIISEIHRLRFCTLKCRMSFGRRHIMKRLRLTAFYKEATVTLSLWGQQICQTVNNTVWLLSAVIIKIQFSVWSAFYSLFICLFFLALGTFLLHVVHCFFSISPLKAHCTLVHCYLRNRKSPKWVLLTCYFVLHVQEDVSLFSP